MGVLDAARSLRPISLDEVTLAASLATRIDRKYLLDPTVAAQLVTDLSPVAQVLRIDDEIEFSYESVYFDTPDHRLHRAAAQRRRRRFKVRTRRYDHTGEVVLELKLKSARGQTVKLRRPHPAELHGKLDSRSLDFLGLHVGEFGELDALAPALTTSYRRVTLVIDGNTRLTHDRSVSAHTPDGRTTELDGSVLETKAVDKPSSADRWLWVAGHRPQRFSKYCTLLAELEPSLPANKWHATRQRIALVGS